MDRKRLAQFLGMLGSDHDGEVVNAARAAHKMIKQAGLTWEEILQPASGGKSLRDLLIHARDLYAISSQRIVLVDIFGEDLVQQAIDSGFIRRSSRYGPAFMRLTVAGRGYLEAHQWE